VSEPGANMDMNDARPASFWRSAGFVALLVAALAGGFLLYAEHRAHLFGALPYLLLLACPLMHVFMHHGHHHGGDSHTGDTGKPRNE